MLWVRMLLKHLHTTFRTKPPVEQQYLCLSHAKSGVTIVRSLAALGDLRVGMTSGTHRRKS